MARTRRGIIGDDGALDELNNVTCQNQKDTELVLFTTCLDRLNEKGLLLQSQCASGVHIDRLTIDSREVGPSDCFVALRGSKVDGHLFIDKAVKNGATAIVSEAGPESATDGRLAGPAFAHVKNAHEALAELASLLQNDPAEHLRVVATTGTNGKTTVATLIEYVLNHTGHKTGFIGTTGYRFGEQTKSASHTTPSAIQFYELLSEMRNDGCLSCSMEASSHAIDQSRFRTSDVNVAIFTNLSRDHLDYHTSLEAYGEAKKRLFDRLSPGAIAITNQDDFWGPKMVEHTKARVVTYGKAQNAHIRYAIRSNELSGLELELDGVTAKYRLAGNFNAENLAAAYAGLLSLGLDANETRKALQSCPPVEGRMQTLLFNAGTTVIVDYAHTPDALQNVLQSVRASLHAGSHLWCLFGCGGDRDTGKRPEMGLIAEACSDHVIVTSDNPRSEAPQSILEDIKKGMNHPEKAIWQVDRRRAIQEAAKRMAPGDTLVLAGKGHETVQVIGTQNHHFDDREEATAAFSSDSTHNRLASKA